jgi:hypothetical protein
MESLIKLILFNLEEIVLGILFRSLSQYRFNSVRNISGSNPWRRTGLSYTLRAGTIRYQELVLKHPKATYFPSAFHVTIHNLHIIHATTYTGSINSPRMYNGW